jgi:hypothetical protein
MPLRPNALDCQNKPKVAALNPMLLLAASSSGIFLVPMLYVTFQRLRERVKKRRSPTIPSFRRPAALPLHRAAEQDFDST